MIKLPPVPRPPDSALWGFTPAPELRAFVEASFLAKDSPLHIEEHEHLVEASIGYLWAGPEAKETGRRILGQAQLIRPPQPKWSSQRTAWLLGQWFGDIDFLVTLSAPYCLQEANDAEVLALLDHELCHCGQALDEFEWPRFTKDGDPVYAIRGHDVEQFVGPTRRWGAAPTGVEELAAAAAAEPLFAHAGVTGCGTCLKAA